MLSATPLIVAADGGSNMFAISFLPYRDVSWLVGTLFIIISVTVSLAESFLYVPGGKYDSG